MLQAEETLWPENVVIINREINRTVDGAGGDPFSIKPSLKTKLGTDLPNILAQGRVKKGKDVYFNTLISN